MRDVDGVDMGLPLGPSLANAFLFKLRRINFYCFINLFITSTMRKTSLLYSPHQTNWKFSKIPFISITVIYNGN